MNRINHVTLYCTKVKVVPYTSVRRGVPVREDTYPEPSVCEVRWPVPGRFYLPSVPTGYPFAAGRTVSERSVRASSRARAVDLPHGRHAL